MYALLFRLRYLYSVGWHILLFTTVYNRHLPVQAQQAACGVDGDVSRTDNHYMRTRHDCFTLCQLL